MTDDGSSETISKLLEVSGKSIQAQQWVGHKRPDPPYVQLSGANNNFAHHSSHLPTMYPLYVQYKYIIQAHVSLLTPTMPEGRT